MSKLFAKIQKKLTKISSAERIAEEFKKTESGFKSFCEQFGEMAATVDSRRAIIATIMEGKTHLSGIKIREAKLQKLYQKSPELKELKKRAKTSILAALSLVHDMDEDEYEILLKPVVPQIKLYNKKKNLRIIEENMYGYTREEARKEYNLFLGNKAWYEELIYSCPKWQVRIITISKHLKRRAEGNSDSSRELTVRRDASLENYVRERCSYECKKSKTFRYLPMFHDIIIEKRVKKIIPTNCPKMEVMLPKSNSFELKKSESVELKKSESVELKKSESAEARKSIKVTGGTLLKKISSVTSENEFFQKATTVAADTIMRSKSMKNLTQAMA